MGEGIELRAPRRRIAHNQHHDRSKAHLETNAGECLRLCQHENGRSNA
jgi:hypothetical protein